MTRSTAFLRRWAPLALALALSACASVAPAPAAKPRLVVLFVVDGLPQRQVTAYRDQLAPDGFARFLERGAAFEQAYYGYSFTVTAAGHATVLSGAYPHRSGIIGNEWVDVGSGQPLYCGRPLGQLHRPQDRRHGRHQPRNLKVETLGDVLRRVEPRSKVIGISGKDRGAILPAGKTGTAYMYMGGTGQFASTTYYMQQHGVGHRVQRREAGGPLLQGRVEAAAGSGIRALAAGQPALVRPGRRQAADDDGQ